MYSITTSTNHERDDVSDAAGQLEHDDDEGDGHPGDAAEGGGRADHGVEAGRDAGLVLAALAAEEVRQGVVVREYHLLHADPHQSGKGGHLVVTITTTPNRASPVTSEQATNGCRHILSLDFSALPPSMCRISCKWIFITHLI